MSEFGKCHDANCMQLWSTPRMVVCPVLPLTVLVYTCGSGVIINNYIYFQKCLYLDNKLYCDPRYTSLTIPGAENLVLFSYVRKSSKCEHHGEFFCNKTMLGNPWCSETVVLCCI